MATLLFGNWSDFQEPFLHYIFFITLQVIDNSVHATSSSSTASLLMFRASPESVGYQAFET